MTQEEKKDKAKQFIFLVATINVAVFAGWWIYSKYIAKK